MLHKASCHIASSYAIFPFVLLCTWIQIHQFQRNYSYVNAQIEILFFVNWGLRKRSYCPSIHRFGPHLRVTFKFVQKTTHHVHIMLCTDFWLHEKRKTEIIWKSPRANMSSRKLNVFCFKIACMRFYIQDLLVNYISPKKPHIFLRLYFPKKNHKHKQYCDYSYSNENI